MKRLDALVLKELIGPWIFGVSMFTMLLVAATYLGRITKFIVEGVPIQTVAHVVLLLLPAVLVQTFAMALLLGALLAFGRLSGDSEITAVRAAGVSLYRIVAPVSLFSLAVASVSFFLNEQVVPSAARESAAVMKDLISHGDVHAGQPVNGNYSQDGHIVLMYGALDFSLSARTMAGAHIIAYDKEERETYVLFAKNLEYNGNLKQWRVIGDADIVSRDGRYYARLHDVWPTQLPQLTTSPEDIFSAQTSDLSVWSMAEIQNQIKKGRANGILSKEQILNYQYGYWNKIALPLAAFIFGTLGATLGIRNHRTGTATGFAIAIAIIFSYFTLANFMNVFALNEVFPPYIASFTPIAIGLVASGVIIWRRNR